MKELDKMSFEELIEWAQSVDWDTVTNEQWKLYESRCKNLAPAYFRRMGLVDLDTFYQKHSSDAIDPWFDAWSMAIEETYPLSDILKRVTRLEKTIDVLLKKYGNEPAGISVAQLSRLKGGL